MTLLVNKEGQVCLEVSDKDIKVLHLEYHKQADRLKFYGVSVKPYPKEGKFAHQEYELGQPGFEQAAVASLVKSTGLKAVKHDVSV